MTHLWQVMYKPSGWATCSTPQWEGVRLRKDFLSGLQNTIATSSNMSYAIAKGTRQFDPLCLEKAGRLFRTRRIAFSHGPCQYGLV